MIPREKSELWQIMHYSTFYNISDLFLPCCMQFTLSSCSPPDIRKVKPLLTHFTCSQHILLHESQSTFDTKGSQGVYICTFLGRIAVKTGRHNWSQSQISIINLIFYYFCQFILCCLEFIALIVYRPLELRSLAVNWKHAEIEGYGINDSASPVDLFI